MIDAIISFSLRQRVFVLLAAAGLLVCGLWSAARLPIDAVPDITNIQVQVNTEVPGLAPEEIEKLVTYPLENRDVRRSGHDRVAVAIEVRIVSDHSGFSRKARTFIAPASL